MKAKEIFKFPFYDVLEEMCRRVGVDIDEVDFSKYKTQSDPIGSDKPLFCDSHEWTKEEEKDFRDWFVDFFYNSAKARRSADCYMPKKKKYIKDKVWPYFMLDFAWKHKKEVL